MQGVEEPLTGSFPVVRELAESEESFVLLPVLGEPDAYMSLFADGSYTRWIPAIARKVVASSPWEFGVSLFGGLALLDALNVIPGI